MVHNILMRIGELEDRVSVNVQTIRFYEREGLLRKPARTLGGYRSYEQQDLDRVTFIRVCQGLGFSLREVSQLIRLHRVTISADRRASMAPDIWCSLRRSGKSRSQKSLSGKAKAYKGNSLRTRQRHE